MSVQPLTDDERRDALEMSERDDPWIRAVILGYEATVRSVEAERDRRAGLSVDEHQGICEARDRYKAVCRWLAFTAFDRNYRVAISDAQEMARRALRYERVANPGAAPVMTNPDSEAGDAA